ncbi:ssrAB-activated protein [Citrobacter amalonaticus]|uniref:SsrAB-activated protein n=1 Tax=Citrobacter amalonaticus TaxID=35703 RepID=A0A2S4S102_CITAM|nr:SrfA family protein [Citrobacter amalonaticus]POT55277.1 ssrAB-activated protein [Citrobacter amalonaticus]POT77115.1 ssrAB-activated protein [Citrobacter amalonaticus]POU67567.1 ssrAB-activated protein [Citrobacter amalonaticus]POV07172.1 ssrAB-activated protein [Citrobacter amalonaticus]
MAKTLLRSGNLDDYQAVGGGGQAVFNSALQIRETLRLRKQQAMVDCLAIPQINDSGDRVDWYSPVDGSVIAWKAADEESRLRALRVLSGILDSTAALSRKSLQSGKTSQQRFGSLLEKTIQFPGENHVFLVGGCPVITFWGFVHLNESVRDDVLDCLRVSEMPEPVVTEAEPEPVEPARPEVSFAQADAPLLVARSEPVHVTDPDIIPPPAAPVSDEIAPPKAAKTPRRIPLWSLPVAAVIIAAVAAPLLWKQDAVVAEEISAVSPDIIAKAEMKPLPQLFASLPLHQAEVSPAVKKEKPIDEPVVIAAIAKDALVMDAGQMKAGTTRFLNGNWRVNVDVKDPVSGKAPSLRYQIQNNKGAARVVHGDNIVCRADVFSGLHQTGELMIKSRGNARCTDGSRYPMPEITCKAGTNDVAVCSARYDAHAEVPLTIKKIGA